jgi:hypothetical protein
MSGLARVHRAARFILAGAVAAAMLAGCGGGGPGALSIESVPVPVVDDVAATAQGNVRPLASELPRSYTSTTSIYFGWAGGGDYSPVEAARGRLIDSNGRFIANFSQSGSPPSASISGEPGGPRRSEASAFTGLTPNGILAGWADNVDDRIIRGFVILDSAGPHMLPDNTYVDFIAESGLAGGRLCPSWPDCHAFHWSPATRVLTEHSHFEAVWMNNSGTMVGYHEPPGEPRRLSTVDPAGNLTPIPFDVSAGVSATPLFIDDDGSIFMNTSVPDGSSPAAGALVILNGASVPIGRGIAALPAVCSRVACVERTRFIAFSATGHAVGENSLHYLHETEGWKVAAEAGFHWTARDGAKAIRVGESGGMPTAVNSHGTVVGALAGPFEWPVRGEPFIWNFTSGGLLLRSLLFPDFDSRNYSIRPVGIGDAGHLLVGTSDPLEPWVALTLFTPTPDVCLPSP